MLLPSHALIFHERIGSELAPTQNLFTSRNWKFQIDLKTEDLYRLCRLVRAYDREGTRIWDLGETFVDICDRR